MSSTIDQQFIEYIVKSLVSKPDEVKIERRIDEKGVLLELTVDPEDLGRVIGKRGATAQSLRTLLRALGTKQDARYNLKIVDPSGGFNRPSHDDNRSEDSFASDRPAQDYSVSDDKKDEVAEDEAADEIEEEESEHSDRISQARKELADLDDLDV
jgi:predicted RNA-binding protein YlqC (UPF0109 family)